MNCELKSLIEDAARLLGLDGWDMKHFNPLDPERGDLWKVAHAAKLRVDFFYV